MTWTIYCNGNRGTVLALSQFAVALVNFGKPLKPSSSAIFLTEANTVMFLILSSLH